MLMPVEQRDHLIDLCSLTRLAVGAASVSIARLDDGELSYEAADGTGAQNVMGLRLPSDEGIAGDVAHTGQSLVIDEVHDRSTAAGPPTSQRLLSPSDMAAAMGVAGDGMSWPVDILSWGVSIGRTWRGRPADVMSLGVSGAVTQPPPERGSTAPDPCRLGRGSADLECPAREVAVPEPHAECFRLTSSHGTSRILHPTEALELLVEHHHADAEHVPVETYAGIPFTH